MKIKQLLLFIILILLVSVSMGKDNSPFVRFPALNSSGSQLAFSYQGDIWTVSASGGKAFRITIHEAYEEAPQWNNDGKQIAFTSNRWGSKDLYVINSTGGIPKRITYNSSSDLINDWTSDNKLLFSTRRTYRQIEWEFEIYSASPNGGTPHRILDSFGDMPAMSPNGKFIAFVKGPCRISREDYHGSANRDLWIYDMQKKKYTQLTNYDGNDFYPRWANNNTIYFVSSRSGKYNVFKMDLNSDGSKKEISEITKFNDNGVRYLSVSKDGSAIAMERGTDIYLMKTNGGTPAKVDIQIGADYRFDPIVHKSFSNKVEEYAVSPNGKLLTFSIHGEIFVKENNKEKKRSVKLTDSPSRDQHPAWASDSTIIFVSDRSGQKDLYSVQSSDKSNTSLFKSLKHKVTRLTTTETDEDFPVVSPNLNSVAYEIGRGKLVVRKINDDGSFGSSETILDGWAIPGNVSWSPDSKWLAYSLDDLDFNEEIFIKSADGSGKPINVSMHPRSDSSPVWSTDGKKLAFVSNRNNGDNDIWFVWLNKKDWEKTKQDWEDDTATKPSKKKSKGKKNKKNKLEVKPIKIDADKIYERLVQVTSMQGDETNPIFSKDGKTIYFTTGEPTTKGRDLYSIKWDGTKVKRITKGEKNPSRLSFNKKDDHIYMVTKGGSIAKFKDGATKLTTLPFKANMIINFIAEKNQIFDEAWRTLQKGFYDPNFHGRNWAGLKNKYKPMIMKASTKRDFRDMFNNMLGQLNASHMGMYGKDRGELQHEKTGLLGIRINPVDDGIIVTHVIANSPADRDASRLFVGDKITKVDGKTVDASRNFYAALTDMAKEKILLSVTNKDGDSREVVIRPTNSLSKQLYDEWVDEKRELTDKYSNGKLGYLHIKAMGWSSFERFERELTAAGNGKEGIVIDVRYNGGGWTTDYLMAVLNTKQHAYTIPRGATDNLKKNHKKFRSHYPFGERLRYASWTKPSIAMCNESSYSNAEIFSHAYKNLEIGKLVGKPTFGAVISTGGQGLIDGSYVRLPFRGWYVLKTDENMEWGPAVPNFIVDNSPDSRAKGKDQQLKKAVDELMKEVK